MSVEKLIDRIINHLKGLDEHPEALTYVTEMDREKYRTEAVRYVVAMTGLTKNTADTRLAGQSRFKSLEILALRKSLSLSWDEVQEMFGLDDMKREQLEILEQAHDVKGNRCESGANKQEEAWS